MAGEHTHKPTSGATVEADGSANDAPQYLPGSTIEKDRRWAIDRARMIMRKEAGGAKSEAGEEAQVSQPGEPAEKEADAVSDKVADDLHGGDGGKKKSAGGKKAPGEKGKDADGAQESKGEEQAGGDKDAEGEAGHEKAPEIGAKLEGIGLKIFRAKKSGKEKADDIPSWAAGCQMNPGETPVKAADRVLRQRFPNGDYPKGPGSEFNKIKKYFERK